MGARLRVFLTPTQETTLKQMRHANNLCQRVKERAEAICLSHHGWYVEKIAVYLNCSAKTVRKTLNQWQKEGLGGLYERGDRGRKTTWTQSDLEYLEESLREEQRRYNSKQLAEKLQRDRGVRLSADHLRQLLKKRCDPASAKDARERAPRQRGSFGSEPDKVIETNKTRNRFSQSEQT